ncbi:hypothetical protein Acr_29g0004160 [Actinidia rufa]|uniref:Uncharacterized protein n=1 Tax=Actinidia rufa TaxID=165716 RepID=A0A7J0HEV2_9ERIC|nr:hypothetical protein Acr_29g0004160 [Actinidia rufa]
MNRKTIGQIRQCIGHEHDEMSAHGLWTKLKEMYRKKTSQNKALMRRLVVKLQGGTTVAEQTSEFQRPQEEVKRSGQRRGLEKEVTEIPISASVRRRNRSGAFEGLVGEHVEREGLGRMGTEGEREGVVAAEGETWQAEWVVVDLRRMVERKMKKARVAMGWRERAVVAMD